jgi:hypothetical protein
VKAFAEDVDAAVDVGNTLAEEGVHVNATARELSSLNESNINICEPEGLADPARGRLIVEGGTTEIVSTHFFFFYTCLQYVSMLVHMILCVVLL